MASIDPQADAAKRAAQAGAITQTPLTPTPQTVMPQYNQMWQGMQGNLAQRMALMNKPANMGGLAPGGLADAAGSTLNATNAQLAQKAATDVTQQGIQAKMGGQDLQRNEAMAQAAREEQARAQRFDAQAKLRMEEAKNAPATLNASVEELKKQIFVKQLQAQSPNSYPNARAELDALNAQLAKVEGGA